MLKAQATPLVTHFESALTCPLNRGNPTHGENGRKGKFPGFLSREWADVRAFPLPKSLAGVAFSG